MTAALTPPLALAYLDQMSADIEAAIVFDMQGETLAGAPSLAAPARALLEVAETREKQAAGDGAAESRAFGGGDRGPATGPPERGEPGPVTLPADAADAGPGSPAARVAGTSRVTLIVARCPAGFALAARDGRHAIVVAAGPLALERLVLHDLETVLSALGGGAAERVLATAPAGAAEAVLSAVRNPS